MKVNLEKKLIFVILGTLIFGVLSVYGEEDSVITAEKLYRGNNDTKAKALITQYLSQNDGAPAYVRVGSMYARLKNWKESVHYLELAQARMPKNLDIQYRLATAYHQFGNEAEAVLTLRRILQKEPKSLRTILALGEVLELSGATTDARQVYEEAHRLLPDEPELFVKLCKLNYLESYWGETKRFCQIASRTRLSQGDSEVFLAMSFFYEDNRDMALKILKGATIKYPKSGLVWRSRGFIYYQEKSYELASQDLGVAAALNQQDDEALILLARSFFEIGKFEEARAAYFLAVLLSREYRFEFISKQKDLERKGKLELAAQYDETLRKADSWGQ